MVEVLFAAATPLLFSLLSLLLPILSESPALSSAVSSASAASSAVPVVAAAGAVLT